MVKVVSFWELGWNTPIKEIDLWRYPLQDFGIDQFYMVPVSGIQSKKVSERISLIEVLSENKSLTPVFVTEAGENILTDFVHPEDAIYITGRTNYSPFNNIKVENGVSVRVPTIMDKGILWGHQAMSIVLYDRMVKSWQ